MTSPTRRDRRAAGEGSGVETEVKLGAWPGFQLPDLEDLPGGIRAVPATDREFDSVHYDTDDLRLIRAGVTVRRRSDEEPPWTVKLPEDSSNGDALVRQELRYADDGEHIPPAVAAMVLTYARTQPLSRVAVLSTKRHRLRLVDGAGVAVGEIDDDEVSVLDPSSFDDADDRRIAARFREVEVEIHPGAPEALLRVVVDRLRSAGAGAPDTAPKLVRALGPRALAPPDLVDVELNGRATGADVVRAALSAAVHRIVDHDPVVRLDSDRDGVHQVRVGARRLRSNLRTLDPLLEPGWSGPLRDELRWLAGELGPVRDADVLTQRLRRDREALPEEDHRHVDAIVRRLQRQRDEALAAALTALESDRYVDLLDRLVEVAREPLVVKAAAAPAKKVLLPLVRADWRALEKAVARAGRSPDADTMHRIRIRAKRARYAADVAVPVVGKPARKLAAKLADLQDVLGARQDAAVAEDWLRQVTSSLTRQQALVAGQLVAIRSYEARRIGQDWRAKWRAVKRKHTEWLA